METLFFIVSKLVWMLIQPPSWIVLGAGATFVLLCRGRLRWARRAAGLTFALCLTFAVLPVGMLLLHPLEARYAAEPPLGGVDGIVVLGGAEAMTIAHAWGGVQVNEAAERLTEAMALARRHPAAKVVVTGGSGRLRDFAKGAAAAPTVAERFFAAQGLAPGRLVLERASRNTAENAVLSRAVARPQPGERWVLVTSAFHMPRAMRSFSRAGWPDLTPWPVDHRTTAFRDGVGWNLADNLKSVEIAIREYVGLLAYGVSGR